jgi:UDP-N-acetyl-D-mannosaminuronate dehydrogenase
MPPMAEPARLRRPMIRPKAETPRGFAGALANCEVAIVLVDHDEFRNVPLGERRHLSVLDTRGIWRDFQGLGLK